MSRRPLLPGAAELFQPSHPTNNHAGGAPPPAHAAPVPPRVGTGRQRHDAKITVYVSAEELVALEQARLSLRAQYGLTVDRGRIVREAVAVLLADFDEHGENSLLVRRLRSD